MIDCPFLATLYYAFQTTEKLYLVMEFVQGGELFSHLYKSEHFGEDQVRFYIAEIIVALEQLHKVSKKITTFFINVNVTIKISCVFFELF